MGEREGDLSVGSFLEVGFLISTKHFCFSSAIFPRKEELGF